MSDFEKQMSLIHAVFNYFSDCYTMNEFEILKSKLKRTVDQILDEDVIPAIESIEKERETNEYLS